MISSSFSSNGTEESTTQRIRSASAAISLALDTPIFSTMSSVWRIPAVSAIFNVIPCRLIYSSSTSLVVPAISVTMALSSPRSRFSREDFPAFGLPRITVRIPSCMIFPSPAVFNRFCIFSFSSATICSNSSEYPVRSQCSGSSNADSMYAIWYSSFSLICCTVFRTEPFNCPTEFFNEYSFLDCITSITASAWERSILPLRNARLVNSPGSAIMAPFFSTVSSTFFMAKTPPWQSISMVSSPVYVRGPRMAMTSTSSTISSLS